VKGRSTRTCACAGRCSAQPHLSTPDGTGAAADAARRPPDGSGDRELQTVDRWRSRMGCKCDAGHSGVERGSGEEVYGAAEEILGFSEGGKTGGAFGKGQSMGSESN